MSALERVLLWTVRTGVFLLVVLTPHIVTGSLFFPFITGKNFFFRIIVELIFGAWLALAVINPAFRPKKSPLLIAISAFVGVLTLAAVFGADLFHSFWSNFERMEGLITHLHLLAFFFVAAHTFKNKTEWFYLFGISIISSFIAAFHAILQHEGILKIVGASRPYAQFGNSIYLGVYLLFYLFIIPVFIYKIKFQWVRVALGLILLTNLYAFFITASRGAFIGLVSGLLFVAVFLLFRSVSWHYRAAGVGIILFLVVIATLIVFVPDNKIVRNVEVLSRLSSVSIENLGQDPRIMIWGIALEAFKARPVLGWGQENFIIPYAKFYNPNLFGNEPWFDRTHNMFLEWLVAGGIVGFSVYLSIFAAIVFLIWKLVQTHRLEIYLIPFIGGFFVAYIVQNAFVFDNIMTYIVLFSVLAFLHSLYTANEINDRMVKVSRARVSETQYLIVAVIFTAVVLVGYSLNAKPILAAGQLINGLKAFSQSSNAEDIISKFDRALSYKVLGRDNFGVTEIRERFADMIINISAQTETPPDIYFVLLDKAITELKIEAARQPDVAKYPLFLGRLYTVKMYYKGEGAESAEQWYQKAIEIAPRYVQGYLGLAEFYIRSGQNDKAVENINLAFKSAPRSASMFYAAMSAYLLANNPDGAESVLLKFAEVNNLRRNRNNFEGDKLIDVARRSMFVTDLGKRIAFLEELSEWAGSNVFVHMVMAQTYRDLGNKDKAEEHALIAAGLDPSKREEVDSFIKSLGR